MWTTLLLTGLAGTAAVAYVVWPLFRRTPRTASIEKEELADLLTRKEVALEAIRDLEFDHRVGKIEAEDFERFNRLLRNRAIRLIEHIDAKYGNGDGLHERAGEIEEKLEMEISRHRRVKDTVPDEGSGGLREKRNSNH